MERPKIFPIFTKKSDFCEKSSDKPVDTFVPNQSYTLSELVKRFERGQRLNVHSNFPVGSNFDHISEAEALQRIHDEQINDADFAPTDIHDIADLRNAYQEHLEHKQDFENRQKKKKQAQQAKSNQAQQAKQDPAPTPPDPAKSES